MQLKIMTMLFVLAILFSSRFVEYVSAIVTGVSLPRTSWKDFRFFKFALPPISMRKKFSKQIQPLLERIVLNRAQLNSIDGMMNDCTPDACRKRSGLISRFGRMERVDIILMRIEPCLL